MNIDLRLSKKLKEGSRESDDCIRAHPPPYTKVRAVAS